MKSADMITEKLNSGTVAVLGFGISNRPLVEFLLQKGCKINVRDAKNAEALGEDYIRMKNAGVNFILGEEYLSDIYEDVIFRSPGIRPDMGSIGDAVKRGAILTSEMEYFLLLTKAYVIAITGSDGKTTTTTLTYKLLEEELRGSNRKVYVGGNIGRPLLPLVSEMTENDFAVIELSSFQLQTMKNARINRAVITNITPNHLNWHVDMEEYSAAKANIFAGSETDRLTVNALMTEHARTVLVLREIQPSSHISLFPKSAEKIHRCLKRLTGLSAAVTETKKSLSLTFPILSFRVTTTWKIIWRQFPLRGDLSRKRIFSKLQKTLEELSTDLNS